MIYISIKNVEIKYGNIYFQYFYVRRLSEVGTDVTVIVTVTHVAVIMIMHIDTTSPVHLCYSCSSN